MDVADEYEALISENGILEGPLHEFLERHSELVPISHFELGHGIRFNSLIAKFPLDTSLITDFAYLTKDSGTWRLVLIEIEPASVNLYTSDINTPRPTADFTGRLTQIDRWKAFLRDRGNEVKLRLGPLLKGFERNPIEFKFMLIVGRKTSLRSKAAQDLFNIKSDENTKIITHDSVLSWFRERPEKRKNILRLEQDHFACKYLTCPCIYTFDTLTSFELRLEERHIKRLERHGFEMREWMSGKALDSLGRVRRGMYAVTISSEVSALHDRLYADPADV